MEWLLRYHTNWFYVLYFSVKMKTKKDNSISFHFKYPNHPLVKNLDNSILVKFWKHFARLDSWCKFFLSMFHVIYLHRVALIFSLEISCKVRLQIPWEQCDTIIFTLWKESWSNCFCMFCWKSWKSIYISAVLLEKMLEFYILFVRNAGKS